LLKPLKVCETDQVSRSNFLGEKSVSRIEEMLNVFVESYIETALWASTDEQDQPLNERFNAGHLSDAAWLKCVSQCADFLSRLDVVHLSAAWTSASYKRAGHDFWLTRNGHGAGFWDGDWPNSGKELTEASKQAGE
jgi:hypothetical protein